MAKPIPSNIPDDVKARFWAKVDVRGPDECWNWTAGGNAEGRGRFSFFGTAHQAPRVAWSLGNGEPIPPDLHACHSCDNPSCCNPAHIWPGTAAENIQDCVAKGRHASRPWDYCNKGHYIKGAPPAFKGSQSRCVECTKEGARVRTRRYREALRANKTVDPVLSERRRKAWETRRAKYGVSGCA